MIGIIGAMDVEVNDIIFSLENISKKEVGSFVFYKGIYKNKELVVVKGGISKINASIATSTMILEYHPKYIITTGIAGGVGDLHTSDIVLINEYIFGDVDVTNFGYSIGQIPGEEPTFVDDSNLIKDIYNNMKKDYDNIYLGACLTQDKFVTKLDDIKFKREVLCCEMESTAIKFTCNKFNTKCIGIRFISDIIGAPSQCDDYQTFETNTAHLSAHICLDLVTKL